MIIPGLEIIVFLVFRLDNETPISLTEFKSFSLYNNFFASSKINFLEDKYNEPVLLLVS